MFLKIVAYLFFLSFIINACIQSQNRKSKAKQHEDRDSVKKSEGFKNKIRILSYNIKHGQTASGKIELKRIAEVINNVRPDVVAIQEVDSVTHRSGYINETAKLAKLTGLVGYFGKYRSHYQGGEFGDAILSKYPLVNFKVIRANTSLDDVPRAYLFAKLKVNKNYPIYFCDVHLSHLIDKQTTIQAKELVNYWKKVLHKKPLIIAGDFNATPNSNAMQVLFKYFNVSNPAFKPTFSATNTIDKIDYILYPKNTNWKVIKFKRICKENASDHCAILSVLRIN